MTEYCIHSIRLKIVGRTAGKGPNFSSARVFLPFAKETIQNIECLIFFIQALSQCELNLVNAFVYFQFYLHN